jgi:hypothetical protein
VKTPFLCAICLLLAALSANASQILDTSYTPTTPNTDALVIRNNISEAQTFTIAQSGTLSSVAVELWNYNGQATQPLALDIRTITGGLPGEADSGSDILASEIIQISTIPYTAGWVSFTLLCGGGLLLAVMRAGWVASRFRGRR